jgi:glucose 1-dehydrogenase
VVVTGAAGGIGLATVRRFAGAGWRVLGIDLEARPKDFPDEAEYMTVDVTDWERIRIVVDQFAESGGLEALVNNAAVQLTGPTLAASRSDWRKVMDVNVWAPASVAQACVPWLRCGGGGSIVNVTSVHALATSTQIGVYAASKGALSALTRALAIELAPDGIRVNAVLPGAVDTEMLRHGLARGTMGVSDSLEALASRTVIGRVGRPEEIAHAIEFLADDTRSSFITGAFLVVDGGATSRLSTE